MQAPLQVIVCAGEPQGTAREFREALISAFQGGENGYLAGADDLGVPIMEFFAEPSKSADDQLAAALHSMMVVLICAKLTGNAKFMAWIDSCAAAVEQSPGRHRLLLLDLDGSMESFFASAPQAGWSQALSAAELGERAIRPTKTALVALHRSMDVVSQASNLVGDKMCMFVSHAKLDGQPLALALTTMIKSLPGFEGFYDAQDIPWGADWRRVLESGVRESILIVLRTEIYESRAWCQREMMLADEYASPLIVVDLRNAMIAPPSQLSFDRAPLVRIPDGNLYRVIFMALREGLRARLHVRTVQALVDDRKLDRTALRLVVRRPTMNALRATCLAAMPTTELVIVYPDPPMYQGELDAANALVASYSRNFRLTTPQTLMVSGEAAA